MPKAAELKPQQDTVRKNKQIYCWKEGFLRIPKKGKQIKEIEDAFSNINSSDETQRRMLTWLFFYSSGLFGGSHYLLLAAVHVKQASSLFWDTALIGL